MEVHFHAAAPDLAGVQAILCTSANGVRALARASGERRLPLLAVGDATAARARAEGFAAVASAGGNAADLARLAAARLDPGNGRLVHVCGSAVAGDLAGDLRARGFAIERAILYAARPVAALSPAAVEAIGSGMIDFALFFSPRTAAIFVRLANGAGVGRCCAGIVAAVDQRRGRRSARSTALARAADRGAARSAGPARGARLPARRRAGLNRKAAGRCPKNAAPPTRGIATCRRPNRAQQSRNLPQSATPRLRSGPERQRPHEAQHDLDWPFCGWHCCWRWLSPGWRCRRSGRPRWRRCCRGEPKARRRPRFIQHSIPGSARSIRG